MPVSATPRIVRGSEGSEVIEWLATVPSPTVETIAAFAAVLVIAPVAITKAMATIATIPVGLFILEAPPAPALGRRVSVSAGWSGVRSSVS